MEMQTFIGKRLLCDSDNELYVRPEKEDLSHGALGCLGQSVLHEMPKDTVFADRSVRLNRDWVNTCLDLCLEVIWLKFEDVVVYHHGNRFYEQQQADLNGDR